MPNLETIVSLFLSRVKEEPDNVAVKFKEANLSYQQLDNISNQVANFLIRKGVVANTLVPICLQSPVDMVIGILGILKAGGAYVPVDADFPVDRIKYMLGDTAAQILISDSHSKQFLAATTGQDTILADNNWSAVKYESAAYTEVDLLANDLAYVIYTSGSTGLPKGVLLKHGSIAHYLKGLFNSLPYNECKSFAIGVSFATDIVNTHLFGSLTSGGELHVFSKEDYNNVEYLHNYFKANSIDCFKIVPSHWKSLSLNGNELLPNKILMFGGEALYTEMLREIMPTSKRECIIVNHYGPTETTVGQLMHVVMGDTSYGHTIPIGKPFTGADVYILDEAGNEVADGEQGELYIGGACVSGGYLNKPELTAEKFVADKFSDSNALLYRTGDIVRKLADGNIEFQGRVDDQVKIRGYRIELGEIESVLQQAQGVKQCVVLAKEGGNGDKRLVAYVVCPSGYDRKAIIGFLESKLPDHMVPRLLVQMEELPYLHNGKVDKKALPNPDASTLLTNAFAAPVSKTETILSDLWKEILGVQRAGAEDNFFELGGTSLLALKTIVQLKTRHDFSLPVVKLYQFPKLKDLASFLDGKSIEKKAKKKIKSSNGDVAIIGMSGRFPGANTIEELWTVLKEGRETVTFFKDDELDASLSPNTSNNPDYVKARGIVENVKEFDAAFFGINPKLAELMDPQQRVFLEIAWEALERGGYVPGKYEGTIGVFGGVRFNTYYSNNVLSHPELVENVGSLQTISVNDKDYVATRTAYTLDLKGPAVNVQSACSTSLVAVAQAVESIRRGQCDMALAGGATINAPVNVGHLYEEGAMLSNDGHCRPFDADAKGTLFSDGAGVVLLKNMEDAIADGDIIYAVIKGVGLSNDGGGKGSFMAPSAEGQASAIRMAIDDAGIAPTDISYIEAHGTATPLGDPIEIEGLKMAFGEQAQKQFCAIGSIKSNFGHLTAAAGVTGLIKAALALHHKLIPASINFSNPNPLMDLDNSPFYVNTELSNWNTDKARYAGVSSFGVGGTNAHILLGEGSSVNVDTTTSRPAQLLCWSAKSEKSLDAYGGKLVDYLGTSETDIADVAYTLVHSRENFNYRRFVVATDANDFVLQSANTKHFKQKPNGLVFMFPGQGDQYVNMGKSLYASEKVFRDAMDECAVILQSEIGENILDVVYPIEVNEVNADNIRHTRYSQPALFSIGYALGKLWLSWGIVPTAFVGHSIGEFVSAYFAGVFSLKDALKLIALRGKMMDALPGGSMLSVRLPYEEVQAYLSADIALAAVNSPQLCVLAGTDEAVARLSEALNAKGILNKVLPTSHAFHSHMMDSVVAPFEQVVKTIQLNAPMMPIASSVTGEWLTETEATSPAYWAGHMRAPVLFGKAVQKLIDDSYNLFLEIGPGKSVATLARQQAAGKPITAISSFEKVEDELPSNQAILKALGNLWINGVEPNWAYFYQYETRRKQNDIPTYAFDKQTYWVDAIPRNTIASTVVTEIARVENRVEQNDIPRKQQLVNKVKEILENASGIEMGGVTNSMSFIEIGLDSLLLTQVALLLKKQFAVSVTFRQLNEDLGTLDLLSEYLEATLPADVSLTQAKTTKLSIVSSELTAEEAAEIKKPFGAIARIEKQSTVALDSTQQAFLADVTRQYNSKTKGSKDYTQEHRPHMADPRVVSGFKPATKELAYSIVIKKSKGSRLWDIDGNEYIDALSGFGSNMLGYQPDFLKEALLEQIENGYEIGPQHALAGEVCKLICEMTQTDRSALCNTGSEAVLGSMRVARTVTGRSLIVCFSGSYHGITDEAIVRGSKKLKSYPAAPGIMPEAVQNMLVLEYGTEETLKIIEERGDEIAAVLVEPVQSRRCDYQPVAFLKKLRHITKASKSVLIFDEVISGFRFHQRGVQGMFGVKADLTTYGKVVGGGMSIGVVAGAREFMDAFDGGSWQFGDNSVPEVGVTYFAGTFVRHPLALATAKATLVHLKEMGPSLQERLNANGQYMATTINAMCRRMNVPMYVAQFGSLWRIHFLKEYAYSDLFFVLMRNKGIHMIEGFPCYITTAHTDEDLNTIIRYFEETLTELKQVNLIPYYEHPAVDRNKKMNTPPMPFAKLGKDGDGNPAWFVLDENNPGKYLQVIS